MPNYGDENHPLTSSKKFGGVRFRRQGTSSKRRSELKAAISGPRAFDGGGVSAAASDDAPLRTRPLHHPNSAFTVLNGLSPPKHTFAGGTRRNSDIHPGQHHSSLALSSNRPAITPIHGSSDHPPRKSHKNPRKVKISKPLALDSSRFSSLPGMSRENPYHSTQVNRGSRWSKTMTSDLFKPDLSLSHQQPLGSNPLDVSSDEFDPRTMMGSFTASLDLGTSAASFGSVKQRTGQLDKSLRTSRATLLQIPLAKPDLVYTDDSDTFSSPPSTPSTPVWETTATSPVPKTDPKLATKLELADVHAQIQAMLKSTNRPFSIESRDHLAQDHHPSNTQRNDIPPSLRPSNPMYKSFPRPETTHKRSLSSPPLNSDICRAHPPDFRDISPHRPIPLVLPQKPDPPAFPPPNTTPTSPTSTTPAEPTTPATPTRGPSSERSDSPSVYSQPSPSSQIRDATPTSSTTSSPDHPYTNTKHERLLAAISEGVSSPTKPGPTAPSILGSGRGTTRKAGLAGPSRNTEAPAVPMIVVTDPNDDDLVYSESGFSIVDMYAGSVESFEVGVRRRRSRTANSYQPRHVLDPPMLRSSVSSNSLRRSQVAWEHPSTSHEPPKRRVSLFRPGLPSSFLSMSTLHDAAETTGTTRDRKSFYAAVGLKGLFRRSSSKGSLFAHAQAQANGTMNVTGGGGGTWPGSTTLAVPSPEDGDGTLKGGWGLFKWKR